MNPPFSLPAERITGLVLGGGGTRGFVCHASAIRALERARCLDLKRITDVHGTSIGAVVGFLLALTRDVEYIMSLATPTLFMDVLNDGHFTNFVTHCAWTCAQGARAFLEQELQKSFVGTRRITFREFQARTRVNLVVNAVNIINCKGEIFSAAAAPDVSVVDAVLASCALPLLVAPQRLWRNDIEGLYVDGGIACNYLGCADEALEDVRLAADATLGVRIVHERAVPPTADAILRSPIHFLTRLAGVILGVHQAKKAHVRTIEINPCSTSIFSLTLSTETIQRLQETAEIAAMRVASHIKPLEAHLALGRTTTQEAGTQTTL